MSGPLIGEKSAGACCKNSRQRQDPKRHDPQRQQIARAFAH